MSVSTHSTYSTYSTPVPFGFLGACEGAALGLVTGWLLRNHQQPPAVFIGCGVLVAAGYYYLLNLSRGTLLSLGIIVLSMVIWGIVGWQAGGFAFKLVGMTHTGVGMIDTLVAWKVLAALLFAFIAYSDKASRSGWSGR